MCSHIHTCNYVGQQGNTKWKVIARAKHQTIKPRHNSILQIKTFELIVGITDELFSVNFAAACQKHSKTGRHLTDLEKCMV